METTSPANQVDAMQEIIRRNHTRLADSRRAIGSMNAHLAQLQPATKTKRKKSDK